MNLMSPVQRPNKVFHFGWKKKKKEKAKWCDNTQWIITDTLADESLSPSESLSHSGIGDFTRTKRTLKIKPRDIAFESNRVAASRHPLCRAASSSWTSTDASVLYTRFPSALRTLCRNTPKYMGHTHTYPKRIGRIYQQWLFDRLQRCGSDPFLPWKCR